MSDTPDNNGELVEGVEVDVDVAADAEGDSTSFADLGLSKDLLQTSKSVLGFWLVPLMIKRRDVVAAAIGELLGAVAAGELEVVIGEVYPLGDAAKAHAALHERKSTGKLLLDPSS